MILILLAIVLWLMNRMVEECSIDLRLQSLKEKLGQ